MNDFSKEPRSVPAEMTEAGRLSPEKAVMSRVRENILAMLDYVELSDDKVKIIREYSDMASEAARSEFERLREESPANRILQALERNIGTIPEGDKRRDAAARDIQSVKQNLANWKSRITEQWKLVKTQGTLKPEEEVIKKREVIEQLMQVRRNSHAIGSGVDPEFCSIEVQTARGDDRGDAILRELGYFPEGTGFLSFFSVPKLEGLQSPQDIDRLMWEGKASRITSQRDNGDMVVGLISDKLPGVVVNLAIWGTGRYATFHFNVDSVVKSTATFPAE